MQTVKIDKFVERLTEIPEDKFCVGNVYDFLRENPVCKDSLSPYLFFSRNCYTRNLIYRNDLFELMAICWNVGQSSLIHDHADQSCWMTMPIGKLRIKNFRVLEQNLETNFCLLEEADEFDLKPDCSAEVQLEQPVHQVLNLPKFNEQAVSVHIYSRPIDKCLVFSTQKNEVRWRTMCYTSKFGKLMPDARL